jgi:hypothetical protein
MSAPKITKFSLNDNIPSIPQIPADSPHANELNELSHLVEKSLFKHDAVLTDRTKELIGKFQKIYLNANERDRFEAIYTQYLGKTNQAPIQKSMDSVQDAQPEKNNEQSQYFTARISKNDQVGLQKLLHIVKKWQKLAIERCERAKQAHLKQEDIDKAQDSRRVLNWLRRDLEDKSNLKKYSYYIAYTPNDGRVQAIGELYISQELINKKFKMAKVELLATHPKNVPLFQDDTPLRGAGTALLAQMTKDIEDSNRKSSYTLLPSLISLASAAPYYKKQGFTQVSDSDSDSDTSSGSDSDSDSNSDSDIRSSSPKRRPVKEENSTLRCGYETDSDDEKTKRATDQSWRCICKSAQDDIKDTPEKNVIFYLPADAQAQFLQKNSNLRTCKKSYWKKLKSGTGIHNTFRK